MRSRPMPHKHIPAILIRYKLSVDHVYSSSVMQICAELQLWTQLALKNKKNKTSLVFQIMSVSYHIRGEGTSQKLGGQHFEIDLANHIL